MNAHQLREAAADAAALARTLARLADEVESESPRAEVPHNLVAAFARLKDAHREALVRVAKDGELDEDSRGRENLWMPIDRAVIEGATTGGGRKRVMTTIGDAFDGVGWGTDDSGVVWAKVPVGTAKFVRSMVAQEANDDLFGLDLDDEGGER